MNKPFIVVVETKEKEKIEKEFNSEKEALDFLFTKQEGKKFENCALKKLEQNKTAFSETFNQEIEKVVNSKPDQNGKYPTFNYEGYKYGAFYNEQFEQFTIWRFVFLSTAGGAGQFQRKPTVIYNLLELYQAEIDEANQILRLERNQGEYVNLVQTVQMDNKIIYILKKEKAIVLGQQPQEQQQQQQQEQKTQAG